MLRARLIGGVCVDGGDESEMRLTDGLSGAGALVRRG